MQSNITFRKLEDADKIKLQEFCDKCKDLGYTNNSSFEAIKLEKMKMPYGQFFVGYDTEKEIIFNLCGVHHMPELNENSYRVFYRGAVLPGYTTKKTGHKSSYQLTVMLDMQIDLILGVNPNAEFYFTTNIEKTSSNAKSYKMNQIMAPKASRNGMFTVVNEDYEYMFTRQRLWKVNVPLYKKWLSS